LALGYSRAMKNVVFGRAPDRPEYLRVMADGQDLKWRWRLSSSPVAVDLLLEQLCALWARVGAESSSPGFLDRFHTLVTRLVREHLVPGDSSYARPAHYEENDDDQRWAFEEKRSPGTFAQVTAGLRYHHTKQVLLLQHEIKMLRRELAKSTQK
jgi:hypothetical protein